MKRAYMPTMAGLEDVGISFRGLNVVGSIAVRQSRLTQERLDHGHPRSDEKKWLIGGRYSANDRPLHPFDQ